MKSPSILLAITVGLIVLLVFVDHTEFIRCNVVRVRQSHGSVFARESVSISVSDTKPDVALKPTSIDASIVTGEEPEKQSVYANDNAIAKQQNQDPFYKVYENDMIAAIRFEATIRAVSNIPDPDSNDYPNCLYTVLVEIDSVLSELPDNKAISREVILDVPIMKDRVILDSNRFLPGDKISCCCAEIEEMPQAIQEIQLSDDIQSFELQQYYVMESAKIEKFSTSGSKTFASHEKTFLPIESEAMDEKAYQMRSERMRSEIERIEKELMSHGGSFAAWQEEYKPIGERYKQLAEDSFSGWINDGFFAAGNKAKVGESTYKTKEYIESVLPYKDYLKKHNIDLIVLRIPSRDDFSARVLTSDDFQENPSWVEHYYECLKNDIEIVDPMPEMWKHRFDLPLFYYYMTQEEYHAFEGTFLFASECLSNILKRYTYKKTDQEFQLVRTKCIGTDSMWFYPPGNPNFPSSSNIEYYRVKAGESVLKDLKKNTGSPFLFLSNSGFGKFLVNDLAVPIYCAYYLQMIPDWFYQEGVGPTLLYNLVSSPEQLSHRKAVIMIGSSWGNMWGRFFEMPHFIDTEVKNNRSERTNQVNSIGFNSCFFIFFFLPLALAIYFVLPARFRNAILAIVSYIFYGWANPWFAIPMFSTTLVDFNNGRLIGKYPEKKRLFLVFSLLFDLGVLGYYKYFNFCLENFNAIVSAIGLPDLQNSGFLRVVLPLGISFYTLHSLSYVIDVYRGSTTPIHSFVDYACYVSLFPLLVAGPVIRFKEVADQLQKRTWNWEKCARGIAFFMLGVGKIVLIASPCGKIADYSFVATDISPADAWLGMFSFAFQIYFDFSGCSDIAVGLGLLLGFTFPKNFDSPYRAQSVSEYWRRWYISLSTWLEDYLFFSLLRASWCRKISRSLFLSGRKKLSRILPTTIALLILWLAIALWFGASWTLVVFGLYHGFFVVFEFIATEITGKRNNRNTETKQQCVNPWNRLFKPLSVVSTFILICFGHILFRADSLAGAWRYFVSLFGLPGNASTSGVVTRVLHQNPCYAGIMLLSAFIIWTMPQTWNFTKKLTVPKIAWCIFVFLLSVFALPFQNYNPFA
jgi:alginate O-acetyltransferase complex protein AlgI